MNELRKDIPRKILQTLEEIERSLGIPGFSREALLSMGNTLVSLADRLPEKTGIGFARQFLSALSDSSRPAEDLRTLLGKLRDEVSMETIEIQILPEEEETITLSDVDLTLETPDEVPVPEPEIPSEIKAEEIPMPEMEAPAESQPVLEQVAPKAESGETWPNLENMTLELKSSEPESIPPAPEPVPESPAPQIETAQEEIPVEAESDRLEAPPPEVHREAEPEEDEFDMSELIPEFIQGARDNIEIVSAGLLELENSPEDKENIEKVFRHCHSLKGSSQVIGFHQIGEVAHAMEDLMRDIHEGKNPVTPEALDLLLGALDQIRDLVDHLAEDSSYLADIEPVVSSLRSFCGEEKPQAAPAPEGEAAGEGGEEDEFDMSELIPEFIQGARDNIEIVSAGLLELENSPEDKENIEKVFRHCHSLKGSSQVIGFHQIGEVAHAMEDLMRDIHEGNSSVTPEALDRILQGLDTIRSLVDHLASDSSYLADIGPVLGLLKGQDQAPAKPAAATPKPAPEKKPEAKAKPSAPAKSGTFQDTIRVSIGKLDTLMNLSGELVSARNWLHDELKTLAAHVALGKNGHNGTEPVNEIRNVFDELDRLVDEFSERILDIRLMPVSTVFSSFPRLVRDLSRKMHKEIQFVMKGEETLLDRKILEAIGDPLVHLIKNSIDHGIELPDERERSGKSRSGLIDLSADQKEGKVLIRIRDDGKGIDPDGIRKSAVGKGLLTQEEADRMSSAEVIGLIFKSGFSTKTEVSEVSGRGVGMDAVKSNIEELRGTVSIQSEKGKGSEMTIILPLSLATSRVILVRTGDETMGIPALFVDRTLRISLDQLVSENGRKQIMLDGGPCPYYDLEEAIVKRPLPKTGRTHASVLIIRVGQTFAAFGVNDILEEREVIIKSLGKNFQNARYLLGGTTLGRGQVVLVLDIINLLESL